MDLRWKACRPDVGMRPETDTACLWSCERRGWRVKISEGERPGRDWLSRSDEVQTHIPLLSEVLLDADADPLQSRLPLVWCLAQLALQPLDVLQEGKLRRNTHSGSIKKRRCGRMFFNSIQFKRTLFISKWFIKGMVLLTAALLVYVVFVKHLVLQL